MWISPGRTFQAEVTISTKALRRSHAWGFRFSFLVTTFLKGQRIRDVNFSNIFLI